MRRSIIPVALAGSIALTACGGDDAGDAAEAAPPEASADAAEQPAAATGLVTVSAADAAATIDAPPDDLVILDVRTPEEFAEAHVDGAVMLDFYRADFADELAKLDRDVPYVLYCRSGNRSGQTLALMRDLGFSSVQDVDGGIVSWVEAGLPIVSG